MLGAKHGFTQSMDGKRGYTLRADNPWIVSRAIPQTARTRTYVSSIVRDIELCDQLATSYSDTLQKRRPRLTEKRSRTIYIRIRTVLVHRILPVSCPYNVRVLAQRYALRANPGYIVHVIMTINLMTI